MYLSVYPFDFHPACTDQWCFLRDADWLTLFDDVVVLGVGADGVYAHRQYADKHNIQFPLLSDIDGQVSQAYSVLAEEFEGIATCPVVPRSSLTLTESPSTRSQYVARRNNPISKHCRK